MKFLSSIISFFASFGRPHPSRDWLVILAILSVTLVVCLAWSIFLFLGIRSGIIVGSAEGETPVVPAVSRTELGAVLEKYEKKEINFSARNYPRPTLSDPAP